MYNNVYIRADGNSDIGLGHLVRCLALSYMIHSAFKITFVCKSVPEGIVNEIILAGFSYLPIEQEKEFLSSLNEGDIVILDHYGLGNEYQKAIKSKECKLVCIDDLHEGLFFADLIINHAPGIKAIDYKAQPYTQFALGLEYALLRPEFLKSIFDKNIKREQGTIFICFGGADHKNLTEKCLQIVIDLYKFSKIIVVIGSAYQYKERLEKVTSKVSHVELYHSITAEKMLDLMQIAALAIVPSSGILLEAMSAGCKVISGKYVNNQQFIYSHYKSVNAFIDAEDFSSKSINAALKKVLEDMSTGVPILIDGLSGNRLLKLFLQLRDENEICLRNAELGDMQVTFNWAKDKKIRKFSFDQTEILEDEHKQWFINKLKNIYCQYLIAESKDQAIGSIRFDIQAQTATVSYLIDPSFQGKGFGISLLKMGIKKVLSDFRLKNINSIIGFVIPDNIPSVKAFERLGFEKKIEENKLKFSKKL